MSTKLDKLLRRLSACPEAQHWAGEYQSLADAWAACERADWMLWLVGPMAGRKGWPDRKQVVLAACACAERALEHVPKGEDRPRLAIKTARRWARGEVTIEEVRAYAASAAAAYASASASAAREKELKAMAKIVRKMLTVPELA